MRRWEQGRSCCFTCEYQDIPATFYITVSRLEGDSNQWPETSDIYPSDHDYKWICGCDRICCHDLEEDCVCYELYENRCEESYPFYLYMNDKYWDNVTKIAIDETEDSENELQPGELLMCQCGCAVDECIEPCEDLSASRCCDRNKDDCGWFHLPYYEVERYDTRPGAQDLFFDILEGKKDFVVRDRWYNWNVVTCDECDNGDVVLLGDL